MSRSTTVNAAKVYRVFATFEPATSALAPPAAPGATGTSGGALPAGTYTYQLTNTVGSTETVPGAFSLPVTVAASSSVALTFAAAPSGTSGIKIYRSDGLTVGLVKTITDNTTTSWTDTGALASTTPPNSGTFTAYYSVGAIVGAAFTPDLGAENQASVTVVVTGGDSILAVYGRVENAVAAAEGLNLAAGDVVLLP